MARLNAEAERENRHEHRSAWHFAHGIEQPAGEAEAVEEAEEEGGGQAAPARAWRGQKTFWSATNTMLAAISGSTMRSGRWMTFMAASVRVMVWASVKALTTLIKSQSVVAASTSALTNNR